MHNFPMPRIEEVLKSIGSAKVMPTVDLAKRYWQIPLSEDAKEKMGFVTPSGLYEFEVMPYSARYFSTDNEPYLEGMRAVCRSLHQ